MNPFMAFTNEEILTKRLVEEFTALGIKEDEIKSASHKAWDEPVSYTHLFIILFIFSLK